MARNNDDLRRQVEQLKNLEDEALESALSALLYRQDCPEKMVLGDYELGLLAADRQIEVAQHLEQCPYCRSELVRFAQSLAEDDLLIAFEQRPNTTPAPAPDPGWIEQVFDQGRAWLEQEGGQWRQVAVTLSQLSDPPSPTTAISGLMSEADEPPTSARGLTITPSEADFELELTVSPDPTAEGDHRCQLVVLLTRLNHFGDFSGGQVTLQWGDQAYAQTTNALGEVTFAQLPCDQLPQMLLTVTF